MKGNLPGSQFVWNSICLKVNLPLLLPCLSSVILKPQPERTEPPLNSWWDLILALVAVSGAVGSTGVPHSQKNHPPKDHHMALDASLLKGPRGLRFLMSEVPLWHMMKGLLAPVQISVPDTGRIARIWGRYCWLHSRYQSNRSRMCYSDNILCYIPGRGTANLSAPDTATGVPRFKETATPYDPKIGPCLGTYGGLRGGGCFL